MKTVNCNVQLLEFLNHEKNLNATSGLGIGADVLVWYPGKPYLCPLFVWVQLTSSETGTRYSTWPLKIDSLNM